ncbi:MAG: endonuclease/exonuclease/phosphatase family protein [Kiritimatiellae bacterium]|jgi:endonuclease/exonuclease/phosphatase (EEP) superfamily protein YafD|nr:endonuclease/exonuclease/phosphatase family protein [Kiritimatiellia bacterium]
MTNGQNNFLRFSCRFSGLLITAGIIAVAAATLGCFSRFSWIMDIFSNFRVQYFIALTIISAILFLIKHKKTSVFFMIVALSNLAFILPLYFGKKSPETSNQKRIMLINVNTRLGNPQLVIKEIHDENPDFVVLEEINDTWFENLISLTNSYPYVIAKTREDNFGICLFSKYSFTDSFVTNIGVAGVPTIMATINIKNQKLNIIATHPLPPATKLYSMGRNQQLKLIPEHIDASSPTLLIGDLNMTPWSYYFRKLIKESKLKDSAKGFGVQASWPVQNIFLRVPLDHCLYSSDISISDRKTGKDVASDHYPLIVDFRIND